MYFESTMEDHAFDLTFEQQNTLGNLICWAIAGPIQNRSNLQVRQHIMPFINLSLGIILFLYIVLICYFKQSTFTFLFVKVFESTMEDRAFGLTLCNKAR